ncbi:hypothetical protein BASA81_007727 [Batrachochytrium salamandrivorans]|nr:hypothetical protein BASA81_007727 [Batrachochytrium salamandrivorans]
MSSKSASVSCEVVLTSSDHLAGDVVRATVSFRGSNETLDWAAAQVHGHAWHDPKLVSKQHPPPTTAAALPPPTPLQFNPNKTAMPDMSSWVEGSTCLFTTKPHCLCAELLLREGEVVTYHLDSLLPPVLPPSFRGTSTRYGYLMTICVKVRTEQFARVAHVPFYVVGCGGGDAAKLGPASSTFVERVVNSTRPGAMRRSSSFSEDLELTFAPGRGLDSARDINYFPCPYPEWTGEVQSSLEVRERAVWRMGRDDEDEYEGEEVVEDNKGFFPPSPMYSPREGSGSNLGGGESGGKAFNVSSSKQRIARCVVGPHLLHPGDACNVKIDLAPDAKVAKVRLQLEVEESIMGPPPLVSAFEPLLVKRTPSGPWIRAVSSRTLNVSLCQSVSASLSTLGASVNFSTDLVFVHSYLKLEFYAEDGTMSSMRVALNVRPHLRPARMAMVAPTPEFATHSPSSAVKQLSSSSLGSAHSASRFDDLSPPPTPTKRLVF